jgi:hypothetical protein
MTMMIDDDDDEYQLLRHLENTIIKSRKPTEDDKDTALSVVGM